MKLRLTITIIGLLLIGMLLINFVLLFFWKHDALQREARYDQAVLAHISSLLIQERVQAKAGEQPVNTEEVTEEVFFADFYESTENGRFFILLNPEQPVSQQKKVGGEEQIRVLLSAAALEAKNTGQPVSRTAASFTHKFLCNDLLVNARPFKDKQGKQGKIIGAIAVVRSLDSLTQTLWQTEKTILLYLLVNVLLLGAIGFLRMAKAVLRPVDRLIALADQYSSYEPPFFVAGRTDSEFGKLSNSLNRMLAKIEEDRKTVQHTVTALEVANQTLQKQQQEMIQTEKLASVGRMAAGLAHEIGNPLSVVQGYLGLLLSSKDMSKQHKDFLSRSEQEIQRIDKLIRQLLDFSRPAKAKPHILSLHELLYSVLEMVKVQTAFRNITIATDFAAENDKLYANNEQLRQVFINCLLNSADALQLPLQKSKNDKKNDKKKEGRRVVVSTALQCPLSCKQENSLQLVVRLYDNGQGIAAEELPIVFDPFYTSKEPGKGTGLGLSVSRSLVETAGGTMELQSEVGLGTCVLLTFPLAWSG
ncbi:MAG: HAMP domain-containing protein [Candidatus Electrothrix sp. AS4_5]|nr:HAMP domain-containing protein [Candidatus Electrothrix gigas]